MRTDPADPMSILNLLMAAVTIAADPTRSGHYTPQERAVATAIQNQATLYTHLVQTAPNDPLEQLIPMPFSVSLNQEKD